MDAKTCDKMIFYFSMQIYNRNLIKHNKMLDDRKGCIVVIGLKLITVVPGAG